MMGDRYSVYTVSFHARDMRLKPGMNKYFTISHLLYILHAALIIGIRAGPVSAVKSRLAFGSSQVRFQGLAHSFTSC